MHSTCAQRIASQQAKPTTDTIAITDMLMDYLYNYPDAIIRYYTSDMLLKITSDAAYLVQPIKARSRAAVHYHLGWKNSDHVNGAVEILCQTIKNVVTSAAESETGGIFIGGKHAIPIRTALEGLTRPSTTGNTTTLPKASSIPKCAKNSQNLSICATGG
jgi:hypothetical protein